jgi:hypothetical protein
MKLLKKSIDPKNILNPGRILWFKHLIFDLTLWLEILLETYLH